MFLIDDLLLMPIDGMKFVFRTLARIAEEQYTDDAPIKERLLELQVKLESGEINEEQYVTMEAEILRDLREIQNRKREMAGLEPEEARGAYTGKVGEGSGASVSLGWREGKKD
ncbi:MAG TPA: gas vesicle protein GvpG [Terriglobales bacterium]|nr:gas vesicle protein GvpG [Terriglobales bacterium]